MERVTSVFSNWFSSAPASAARKAEEFDDSVQQRTGENIAKLDNQISRLKRQLEAVEPLINAAVESNDREKAAVHVRKRAEIRTRMQTLQVQRDNLKGTQRVYADATNNVEQARLYQDAASGLDRVTQQMNEINVAESMDAIQDCGAVVDDYSAVLTTPLFESSSFGTVDVDDEVDRLMAQRRQTAVHRPDDAGGNLDLPSIPSRSTADRIRELKEDVVH